MLFWQLVTTFFVLSVINYTGHGVRINKLVVPEVTSGANGPILLDCDYTLEEPLDEGLVVKWFLNNSLVYQWIPKIRPLGIGILKGRVNLDYVASIETHGAHRALNIIRPGPDLSGDYTCLVSTFLSEDRKTKNMLVYVPAKSLVIKEDYFNGFRKAICIAEGVFPKPNFTLRINDSDVSNFEVSVKRFSVNGAFDVEAVVETPTPTALEEFSCIVRIPEANYTVTKQKLLYPGYTNESTTNVRQTVLIVISIVITLIQIL